MKEELKPCPFCGDLPVVSFYEDESLFSHEIVIWSTTGCSGCDIEFNVSDDKDGVQSIKRWNTRI